MTFDFAGYLSDGLRSLNWVTADLWIAATGLAGFMSLGDVRQITGGEREPSETEYDVLALALNEEFTDRGLNHPVNYWQELPRI
jgi:hypothetical protein